VVATINDSNYAGTTTGTLVISKATATVTLTPASLSQTYTGSPLSVTSTTSPTGLTVTYTYNGSSTAPTAAGSYPVVATINDSNYSGTTAGTLVIGKATAAVTWATPSAITYGTPLGATQLDASAGGLAGTFVYSPAAGALLNSGTQTLSVTFTPTDSADYSIVTRTVQLNINQATAAVSVASSANPVLLQSSVSFTATISSVSGTPTGTVSFLDGTTPLGSSPLSAGIAVFSTSSLAVGTRNITAIYSGDANFPAATSAALSQTVLDFGISPSTSSGNGASQTAIPGGTATYILSVVPTTGTSFPTIATLTVTGLPSGTTATLNSPAGTQLTSNSWSLPANTALTAVSLSFRVQSMTASADRKQSPLQKVPTVLWGILLLPFAAKWRRAGKQLGRAISLLLLLAVGAAALAGLSGCGTSNGFFDQQQKSYVVTVTLTSGALSHSTNVTLTVE
jgi:hypothetical protein